MVHVALFSLAYWNIIICANYANKYSNDWKKCFDRIQIYFPGTKRPWSFLVPERHNVHFLWN